MSRRPKCCWLIKAMMLTSSAEIWRGAGGTAMIPTKRNRTIQLPVDYSNHALRNMVERCFNKLKITRSCQLAMTKPPTANSASSTLFPSVCGPANLSTPPKVEASGAETRQRLPAIRRDPVPTCRSPLLAAQWQSHEASVVVTCLQPRSRETGMIYRHRRPHSMAWQLPRKGGVRDPTNSQFSRARRSAPLC